MTWTIDALDRAHARIEVLEAEVNRFRGLHEVAITNGIAMEKGLSQRIRALEAENAALREDKARLDRLERELLYNPAWPLIGCLLDGSLGILDMDAGSEFGDETATDPTLRGALDKAFARLDAARKEA